MENIKFESLFKKYEPPEGGIHGLNKKLEKQKIKNSLFTFPKMVFASAFATVIILTVLLYPDLMRPKNNLFIDLVNESGNPALIKYGYLTKRDEGVSIPANERSRVAVLRVKTSNKNVKFYIIESISNDTFQEKTDDPDINNSI